MRACWIKLRTLRVSILTDLAVFLTVCIVCIVCVGMRRCEDRYPQSSVEDKGFPGTIVRDGCAEN